MATSTPNYGLKKFENGDPPDLPSLAASMDKIDTELKKNETNIGLLNLGWDFGAALTWQEVLEQKWTELPRTKMCAIRIIAAGGIYNLIGSLHGSLDYGAFTMWTYTDAITSVARLRNGVWTYT